LAFEKLHVSTLAEVTLKLSNNDNCAACHFIYSHFDYGECDVSLAKFGYCVKWLQTK